MTGLALNSCLSNEPSVSNLKCNPQHVNYFARCRLKVVTTWGITEFLFPLFFKFFFFSDLVAMEQQWLCPQAPLILYNLYAVLVDKLLKWYWNVCNIRLGFRSRIAFKSSKPLLSPHFVFLFARDINTCGSAAFHESSAEQYNIRFQHLAAQRINNTTCPATLDIGYGTILTSPTPAAT